MCVLAIGTMIPFYFIVLLLIFPVSLAVCQVCFGEATPYGCSGNDMTTCPWNTGVAANATAVAGIVAGSLAATKMTLTINSLLPDRFRRLFPRNVLDLIMTIYSRPRDGTEFDPEGKSLKQVSSAIKAGTFTKQEAMLFLAGKMDDLDADDENYEVEVKRIATNMSVLKDLPDNLSSSDSLQGVFIFVLAKLSGVICKTSELAIVLDTCSSVDEEVKASSSGVSIQILRSAAPQVARDLRISPHRTTIHA